MKFIDKKIENDIVKLYDEERNEYIFDTKEMLRIEETFNSISPLSNGYVQGRLIGSDRASGPITIHRWIMGLQKGDVLDAHHLNENKRDNRRQNLEVKTKAGHMREHGKSISVGRKNVFTFRGDLELRKSIEHICKVYDIKLSYFLERAIRSKVEECLKDLKL